MAAAGWGQPSEPDARGQRQPERPAWQWWENGDGINAGERGLTRSREGARGRPRRGSDPAGPSATTARARILATQSPDPAGARGLRRALQDPSSGQVPERFQAWATDGFRASSKVLVRCPAEFRTDRGFASKSRRKGEFRGSEMNLEAAAGVPQLAAGSARGDLSRSAAANEGYGLALSGRNPPEGHRVPTDSCNYRYYCNRSKWQNAPGSRARSVEHPRMCSSARGRMCQLRRFERAPPPHGSRCIRPRSSARSHPGSNTGRRHCAALRSSKDCWCRRKNIRW